MADEDLDDDEVIDAADDDLVDIDGGPDNPMAAVLGGGGLDFGALLEQASQMQSQLMAAQQHAAETLIEGISGGGAVKVTLSGDLDFKAITIEPSAVDPSDIEMLQDLVLAAVRHGIDQVNQLQRGSLDLGGLDIGGLLGGGGPLGGHAGE
jgi:DNA-binding YbaB/EbfC family protein